MPCEIRNRKKVWLYAIGAAISAAVLMLGLWNSLQPGPARDVPKPIPVIIGLGIGVMIRMLVKELSKPHG